MGRSCQNGRSRRVSLTGSEKEERCKMKNIVNIADRMAGLIIAAGLLVTGAGFIVLGVSLFPVVGVFVGLAAIRLALYFMNPMAIGFERTVGAGDSEGWYGVAKAA